MEQVTSATKQEGVIYGLVAFSFSFMFGSFLCFTIIGAIIGIPMIIYSLWCLVTCPWAYKKLYVGPCPYCKARCTLPKGVPGAKCRECKKRYLLRDMKLVKLPD